MALSKTITKKVFGKEVVLNNTYIKIMSFSGDKENITLNVQTFINEDKKEVIENKCFSFVPDYEGENLLRQAYEYLKTLEEYADAADC